MDTFLAHQRACICSTPQHGLQRDAGLHVVVDTHCCPLRQHRALRIDVNLLERSDILSALCLIEAAALLLARRVCVVQLYLQTGEKEGAFIFVLSRDHLIILGPPGHGDGSYQGVVNSYRRLPKTHIAERRGNGRG